MYSHFGANVVNLGTNYGLVTYSKYPIKSEKHIYLSSDAEQRGLLHTVVNVDGKKLNIINVHLGVKKEEREIQIKEVLEFVKSLEPEPYIVVGDFNEGEISLEGTNLKDVAEETDKSNVLTFASGLYRIDYILVSSNIEVIDYNVLFKNMSDHLKDVAEETDKSNVLTFASGLYRIDYILVSSNIEVIDYNVLFKNMSDHYPIIARLKI